MAHAIANATGVWIKELPISSEKILWALKEKEKKGDEGPRGKFQKGRPCKPYKGKPVRGKRAVDPKVLFGRFGQPVPRARPKKKAKPKKRKASRKRKRR